MIIPSISHTFKRYRTLQTDVIRALPIAILMPHSACNCRCVMCDIWKGNQNVKQLSVKDVEKLLDSLKKLGTRQVVMSGGEALLNPGFFSLCKILQKENIKITLLSTGLLLTKHAAHLLEWVDDIIVSLDGDEKVHDLVRNIPGAFLKLKEGVGHLHLLNPSYPVTGRTVIHRQNFRNWPAIIEAGAAIGLKRLSFLPADVSSEAFNRPNGWDDRRQNQILLSEEEWVEMKEIIGQIIRDFRGHFESKFIAESPEKIRKIGDYYGAFYGHNPFPYKKCNAPWVSTVVEADGTVRPCFFHPPLGNIHNDSLTTILNSEKALRFRKSLDIQKNEICAKCVCYLNLSPRL
jgi:Fe-coproporphyrin III synthase